MLGKRYLRRERLRNVATAVERELGRGRIAEEIEPRRTLHRSNRTGNRCVDLPDGHQHDARAMGAPEITREDFERYFPYAPTALCIKESARLRAMHDHALVSPLLDVGCGDGVFASLAFRDLETWGIDVNPDEVALAERAHAYSKVILGDVTTASLPEGYFRSCVANCSLEHIERIDLALQRIFDSLAPGAMFYALVPNQDWAESLLSYRMLRSVGGSAQAKRLQREIDKFFVHHHLYDAPGWQSLVEAAGFEVTSVDPILSNATTSAYELFLLPSLIGLVNKKLTKRWTNFPRARKLLASPAYALTRAALATGNDVKTAEFLIVARKPESSAEERR